MGVRDDDVDELYEYKNLSSNIDDTIEKTQFLRQACLNGAEVFILTSTLLTKLEHCQSWFLKITFYVPKFAPNLLLQRMSGLNCIESEIALRKLLSLGRLITEPKMAQSVRSLFMSKTEVILMLA